MRLSSRSYRTVTRLAGPLLFLDNVHRCAIGEMVSIHTGKDAPKRRGQVLEISEAAVVIQVLEDTAGLDITGTTVVFTDEGPSLDLAPDMVGRMFNGIGEPVDGAPPLLPVLRRTIGGAPMNPASRARPRDFIQTGMSAIDVLNTLVRGQKLPIFSGSGLPANELAAQIACGAGLRAGGEPFAVVFAAMGITHRESSFFLHAFSEAGALDRLVVFLNLADDPTVERLLTPRMALTAAEYLAFDLGRQVLVILTDMTSYCEAVREISTAREEIPGRRGYPGYLYSDLATIYERAGRLNGREGSITLLPILTMPDDDITHPVPDLTGYITEGQIVLSRSLHRRGIFPPIDVLPCLSRLMNSGIGDGRTREDHKSLADQLYSVYAQGRELRRLEAIVGEAGLSEMDRKYLRAAQRFEEEFVGQGNRERSLEESLEQGWSVLGSLPPEELIRVHKGILHKYYRRFEEEILERRECDIF